jgi:hypothetical protein
MARPPRRLLQIVITRECDGPPRDIRLITFWLNAMRAAEFNGFDDP